MPLWDEAIALISARAQGPGFRRVLFGYSPEDGYPRLHLDRYGDWWLATFHAPELAREEIDPLVSFLASTGRGVVLKFRNDDRRASLLGTVVSGDPGEAGALTVEQTGYRFEARLSTSLDAGAHADAETLRQELLGTSRGKSLLNLYASTCLFGVAASLGGARSVVNVDVSRQRLAWGKKNYSLNGLRADGRDFVAEDAVRFCRRHFRDGGRFDAVVVDPPPFYSTGKMRRSSEELIERDLEAALDLAAPGGATVHFLRCTARVSARELGARVEAVLGKRSRPASFEVRSCPAPEVSPRELTPSYKEARIVLPPA